MQAFGATAPGSTLKWGDPVGILAFDGFARPMNNLCHLSLAGSASLRAPMIPRTPIHAKPLGVRTLSHVNRTVLETAQPEIHSVSAVMTRRGKA